VILGSDEREHWFLVKGGEDVRLDERVEQLFGIINSLVAPDAIGLRPLWWLWLKEKGQESMDLLVLVAGLMDFNVSR
jgi:hypothetical protein